MGVGVGVGSNSQSNIDEKYNTSQLLVGVGVGVIQNPSLRNALFKSGHSLIQGDLPVKKQGPSRDIDKHHWVPPVE